METENIRSVDPMSQFQRAKKGESILYPLSLTTNRAKLLPSQYG